MNELNIIFEIAYAQENSGFCTAGELLKFTMIKKTRLYRMLNSLILAGYVTRFAQGKYKLVKNRDFSMLVRIMIGQADEE